MSRFEKLKTENMENDSLKNIEKYLFEMVIYMRISILIGIISLVYFIYTIISTKNYFGIEFESEGEYRMDTTVVF
jgi:hypothetical protein